MALALAVSDVLRLDCGREFLATLPFVELLLMEGTEVVDRAVFLNICRGLVENVSSLLGA